MHRVFVYGTLKRGQPNHGLFHSSSGQWTFLGRGQTVEKLPLIVATPYNIPFLLDRRGQGQGQHVIGEIYDVDDAKLEALDELERHPEYYTRTQIDIRMVSGLDDVTLANSRDVTERCWAYLILDPNDDALSKTHISEYKSEAVVGVYVPPSERLTQISLDEMISMVKKME